MLGEVYSKQLYKELVAIALREGYQITEQALKKLEKCENPVEELLKTIEKLKNTKPDEAVIDETNLIISVRNKSETVAVSVREIYEEHHPEFTVVNHVEDNVKIEGTLEEFQKYFLSRYHLLRKILEKRKLNFIPVAEAAALKEGDESYLAVMIQGKQEKANSIYLEADDPSGTITIMASKKNTMLLKDVSELVYDVVVGVKVRKSGETYVLRELVFPDVEDRKAISLTQIPDTYVCLISDIHVGSKHFRADLFEKFLDWLNRGRDGEVKRLTHLVVAGDIVEGVGIYPGQESELEIKNVEEQLREAGRFLSQIPERITVVLSVGNHEPVRKALPQPTLQPRHRALLELKRKIVHVSNPATLVLDGRLLLIYHGQGLDELIQYLPEVSYSNLREKAVKVIEALLRFRHLAPIYGENTQILPLNIDSMAITETPHLLQTGHIHVTVNSAYKGVRLVNAGAWQDQTRFQRSMGLEPMVGYAALVNLANMNVTLKYFGS